jgi:hypothetical protein
MATALSDGRIYLIESDAADNQNWVPTPSNIDLDNFTEGTDFCQLKIPQRTTQRGYTGILIQDASGGAGFMTRSYRRGYLVTIMSNELFETEAYLIDKFIMNDRHVATSTSTYTNYYLVICRDQDDTSYGYAKYTNSAGSQVNYLKGAIPNDGGYECTWTEGQNLRAQIKIVFKSAW